MLQSRFFTGTDIEAVRFEMVENRWSAPEELPPLAGELTGFLYLGFARVGFELGQYDKAMRSVSSHFRPLGHESFISGSCLLHRGASVAEWSKTRAYRSRRLSPPGFRSHLGRVLV